VFGALVLPATVPDWADGPPGTGRAGCAFPGVRLGGIDRRGADLSWCFEAPESGPSARVTGGLGGRLTAPEAAMSTAANAAQAIAVATAPAKSLAARCFKRPPSGYSCWRQPS
jgi:hypothetical protein